MNLRAVGWLLGWVHLVLAGFMLMPAVVSAFELEEDTVQGCLWAAFVTAAVGGLLVWSCRGSTLTKEGRVDYFRREMLAVIGLSWFAAGVMGALPFLFSGAMRSPVDAFFESVSGFTTTGATILTASAFDDPATPLHEGLSHGVMFWRSFTQWLGGIGIVIVFVVIFPAGGRSLFRREVGGVSREALQQRVRDSALGLLRAYVVLTLAEVVLLWLLTRDLFDAFLHSFGTLATGGFSDHAASIRHYLSWKVELVIALFMFLAGINFAVYDTFLRKGLRGARRAVRESAEVKTYALVVVGSTLFIGLVLWFWGGGSPDEAAGGPDYAHLSRALRDSLFGVVSIVTTTGYGTQNFDRWPTICRVLLMVLALTGACAGSTGGGIKVVRMLILCKAAVQGIRRFARPRAVEPVRMSGRAVEDATVGTVAAYFGLWVLVFFVATVLLAGMGLEPPGTYGNQVLLTAATSVIATLNNIGPGLAAVGPWENFAFMPDAGKLLLSFCMIFGRLEFYAVLVLFVPRFWKS